MSLKILTFDRLTQDHVALIGDGSDDLFNDSKLKASLPTSIINYLDSKDNIEGSETNWGWQPKCPCGCACDYITDLNLGQISLDIDFVPYPTISETYERVSLFDLEDGTVSPFGEAENMYYAYISRQTLSNGGCFAQIGVTFSATANGEGAGATGLGLSSMLWAGGQRTVYIADWAPTGYPNQIDPDDPGSGSFGYSYEPTKPYPSSATMRGNWNDGTDVIIDLEAIEETGIRARTGNETYS